MSQIPLPQGIQPYLLPEEGGLVCPSDEYNVIWENLDVIMKNIYPKCLIMLPPEQIVAIIAGRITPDTAAQFHEMGGIGNAFVAKCRRQAERVCSPLTRGKIKASLKNLGESVIYLETIGQHVVATGMAICAIRGRPCSPEDIVEFFKQSVSLINLYNFDCKGKSDLKRVVDFIHNSAIGLLLSPCVQEE